MKLTDVAAQITAHLKRFEADKAINRAATSRIQPYYLADAFRNGRWVAVRYVNFQGWHNLTREQAERYLTWLDAGNVGKHYQALQEPK